MSDQQDLTAPRRPRPSPRPADAVPPPAAATPVPDVAAPEAPAPPLAVPAPPLVVPAPPLAVPAPPSSATPGHPRHAAPAITGPQDEVVTVAGPSGAVVLADAPREFTSEVVAPAQIAIGVVIGVVLGAVLYGIDHGLWPYAIVGFVVVVAASVWLAVMRVEVTPRAVVLGQGRRERDPRTIGADEILVASGATLTWGQCFGFGLPAEDELQRDDGRATRFTVRPGPTLWLRLRTGEVIWVSVTDPAAAVAVLTAARARR